MSDDTFTATRDQLVDAIACLKVNVATSGPAKGLIMAESMADAIIEALADQRAALLARELTVYPPVEAVYGRCETCRTVRWGTERGGPGGGTTWKRSLHCGCCTHPHDLLPGGHVLPSCRECASTPEAAADHHLHSQIGATEGSTP
jgi:hypothetical protein